ncbi:histidinol dehydrogenase [Patescibacteria group bacterium]|nr:MAG: histidinol dehydrogenase [Patescibacteria group bacterium]
MKTYRNLARDKWPQLTKRPTSNTENLVQLAKQVFTDVDREGDRALRKYTKQFDNVELGSIRISQKEIEDQAQKLDSKTKTAIDIAYRNIYEFHAKQLTSLESPVAVQSGVVCWREIRPIDRVGLYVPGGSAPLVSTVLMLGVPAKIAGSRQVILATPPDKNGTISPAICYAALKVGITNIVRIGGMQAIAAMTLGTESVLAVDKLFGPGNQYVMAAKQYAERYGVASDMPAGPSEVLVVADQSAYPEFVAADLLSQAEHGPDSQVVLLTTNQTTATDIQKEIECQLATLPRKDIAIKALVNSFCIIFDDISTAIDFANSYAPEHIILSIRRARSTSKRINNAGSVFLGNYSPESAGDYASGTNHTLPTNGWARSFSGLSVESFVRRMTFQKLTKPGLKKLGTAIKTLAETEGLDAHKRAITIRFQKDKEK